VRRRLPVSGLGDFRGDGGEPLAVTPDQRHERSQRGEFMGRAAPDAAAAAGDEDPLAVERAGPEHRTILHGLPLLLPTILGGPVRQESVLRPKGREG
jgi:hypothetical protein